MKISDRFILFGTFVAMWSCGVDTFDSQLMIPPATVYRYNALGEVPVQGAFLSQLGTRKGKKITYFKRVIRNVRTNPTTIAESGCIVYGPYFQIGVRARDVSHFDGRVYLTVSDGSVIVDLAADSGRTVYDRKTISAPFDGHVDLNGPIISEPVKGVEVRVCNPVPGQGERIGDEARPSFSFEHRSSVTVSETQIIFN